MIFKGESNSKVSAGSGYWCLGIVWVLKVRDRRAWTCTPVDSCGVKVLQHLLCLQPGQSIYGLAASQPLRAQQGSNPLPLADELCCLRHAGNAELGFSTWRAGVRAHSAACMG